MKLASVLCMCLLLAGCGRQYEAMMGDKPLSPVGSGLERADRMSVASVYPVAEQGASNWIGGPADYFRDRRPRHVGDLLTVDISINDKASLSNNSNRSRKASAGADLGFTYDLLGVVGADVNGKGDVNSNSSQQGQGATTRSEKIELAVAAVVTEVLPNGYLVIRGTQEIQVNSETRVLQISGIVLPRDISDKGRLPYDRIAEARITYGGNGTITDVQKPGWGQRLWDKVTPF
jgi:flagellar L-ring protein precursor FlgH